MRKLDFFLQNFLHSCIIREEREKEVNPIIENVKFPSQKSTISSVKRCVTSNVNEEEEN